MARVLIIDDDEAFCSMLSRAVLRQGHEVVCANTCESGLAEASECPYDLVYLDVNLPDGNGLAILPQVRAMPSRPEVIIVTGTRSAEGAELAINYGAWDYIGKSSSRQEMTLPLVRALQYREAQGARRSKVFDRGAIVGNSRALGLCLEAAAQAASSDANVLITGETGSGKEIVATAIHENSARKRGNFVVVDCAALPDPLVESILFGHTKGAFTGADRDREGLVLQAHNGTLFLDEVGELPEHLQRAFLRVLQEHRFRPVGGQHEQFSNFRLIAATNRDLAAMVQEGRFRQDLYFRLRVLTIEAPPLRNRREDIKSIAIDRIHQLCQAHNVATKGFAPEFFSVIEAYDWPGNVRELLHTLDRVFVVAGGDPILVPKHLPPELRVRLIRDSVDGSAAPAGDATPEPGVKALPRMKDVRDAAIAAAEERYLLDLMTAARGDIPKACQMADLSVSRLYELLKRYGISRQGVVDAASCPKAR